VSQPLSTDHAKEVAERERFEFGRNWIRFLEVLNDERIAEAQQSLQKMLGKAELAGKTFLDAGCGSGLFSLAARRLGARVHSFDYDPQSVACAERLRNRYFPQDPQWLTEVGSVLDNTYLDGLGTFDIVYSWGVLHHTGAMWTAMANLAPLVADGGYLFVSIYNDQGQTSCRWTRVKRAYNRLPSLLRIVVLGSACVHLWWRRVLKDFVRGRPLRTWREAARSRGMSAWRDVVDWVGGYPFEVAKPERVFDFYFQRGFTLIRMITQGGDLGCNEFVFRKGSSREPSKNRRVC
jgi:2-polyprenyl-6-hydroxyphenyl methylase/3-demethylubiquinone-9 3-methyltransferase